MAFCACCANIIVKQDYRSGNGEPAYQDSYQSTMPWPACTGDADANDPAACVCTPRAGF